MKRRTCSLLTALALSLGLCSAALAWTDVEETDWFYQEVTDCTEQGLFREGEAFRPEKPLTRLQAVELLYTMAGRPEASAPAFTDVAAETEGAAAVGWAAREGITQGYGDGRFGPEDPVTREQLAQLLHRYAISLGRDVSIGENTNILSYFDVFDLSEWAYPAMQWACGAGIIQGYEGYISPTAPVTRAQAAVMAARFLAE